MAWYSLIALLLDSKVRQICIGSLPVRIFPHFRYLLQVRLHSRKGFFADHMLDPAGIFGRSLFVHA